MSHLLTYLLTTSSSSAIFCLVSEFLSALNVNRWGSGTPSRNVCTLTFKQCIHSLSIHSMHTSADSAALMWHFSSFSFSLCSFLSTGFSIYICVCVCGCGLSEACSLKPRPHQQQCRSNVRLCQQKPFDLEHSTMLLWHCCVDGA